MRVLTSHRDSVTQRPIPTDSYMTYCGLLLYTLSDQDDSHKTVLFSLRCLGTFAQVFRHGDPVKAIVDGRHLVDQHLLHHIGAERLVLRFKQTLSCSDPLQTDSLYFCLLAVWIVACSPSMRPLLITHGLFEGVNRSISHQDSTVQPNPAKRLKAWTVAHDILGCASTSSQQCAV